MLNQTRSSFPFWHISCDYKIKGIARDIVNEAGAGDYGTIVLGRRGISSVEEFFMGRVANKVINTIRNRAV